jgi:hypothetical protein
MGDEEVLNLRQIQGSHKTKMPKILLQKAEEIFPALKESMVSVVHMK